MRAFRSTCGGASRAPRRHGASSATTSTRNFPRSGYAEPMDPISDRQRNELLERLTRRRGELRAEIQRELEKSDDPRVAGFMNHFAETEAWGLADILADLDVQTVTRDVAELSEVEAALVRLDDGSYGTCADCGEPIGWPRLNAQPTADRCIACQEKVEQRAARMGHP